jgi:hypothetical protein
MKKHAERNGQPRRELSEQQQAAVELLAAGQTDKDAASTLNLPAASVVKWRMHDPVFQAALNACRADAWRAGIDRLRSMVPKALDALANELNRADNPDRCKIALDILRLAKLADISPQGPEEPETIVRLAVNRERQQARGPLDDFAEDRKGLPAYDDHLAKKWAELESKALGEAL